MKHHGYLGYTTMYDLIVSGSQQTAAILGILLNYWK